MVFDDLRNYRSEQCRDPQHKPCARRILESDRLMMNWTAGIHVCPSCGKRTGTFGPQQRGGAA